MASENDNEKTEPVVSEAEGENEAVADKSAPESQPSTEDNNTAEPDSFSQPKQEADEPDVLSNVVITWVASEFIGHDKSPGWYGILALAAAVFTGLVYLFTRDIISSGAVVFVAIIFGISAARKPRQLEYTLDNKGLRIGQKYYDYGLFRSFAVVPEGSAMSIIFMPLKRFSTLTTIYYPPEEEARIINLLTAILPNEEYKHDLLDQFMHNIRF